MRLYRRHPVNRFGLMTLPFFNLLFNHLAQQFNPRANPFAGLVTKTEPKMLIGFRFHQKRLAWGDGKATRSYCHIDDCVRGTERLMESDHDKPINIGSDRLISVEDLTDMVIGISGKKIAKEHDLSAPEGVRGRNADLTLVKKVLGWEPRVSLEEGMDKTYHWINMIIEKDSKSGG